MTRDEYLHLLLIEEITEVANDGAPEFVDFIAINRLLGNRYFGWEFPEDDATFLEAIKKPDTRLMARTMADTIKAVSKVMRFTPGHKHVSYDKTNFENAREWVSKFMALCVALGYLKAVKPDEVDAKIKRVERFMAISFAMGTLDGEMSLKEFESSVKAQLEVTFDVPTDIVVTRSHDIWLAASPSEHATFIREGEVWQKQAYGDLYFVDRRGIRHSFPRVFCELWHGIGEECYVEITNFFITKDTLKWSKPPHRCLH